MMSNQGFHVNFSRFHQFDRNGITKKLISPKHNNNNSRPHSLLYLKTPRMLTSRTKAPAKGTVISNFPNPTNMTTPPDLVT
jgi:hypothetical protein